MHIILSFFVITLSLIFTTSTFASECNHAIPSYNLNKNTTFLDLTPHTGLYHDEYFADPTTMNVNSHWCINDERFSITLSEDRLRWQGIRLYNQEDTPLERVIYFPSNLISNGEVYLLRNGKVVKQSIINRQYGLSQSNFVSTYVNILHQFEPKESIDIIFVVSNWNVNAELNLDDITGFNNKNILRLTIIYSMVGAMIGIIAYQLLINIGIRDKSYHPIILFTSVCMIFEVTKLGYAHFINTNLAMILIDWYVRTQCLTLIFGLYFSESFLKLRENNVYGKTLLNIAYIAFTFCFLYTFISEQAMIAIFQFFVFVAIVSLAGYSIYKTIVHRSKNALLYFIGFIPIYLGALTYTAAAIQIIPTSRIMEISVDIGMLGGILLFSLIVANQVVDKRKKQSYALIKSQQRYELAIEGANDGIFELDLQTHKVEASERACSIMEIDSTQGWLPINSLFRKFDSRERKRIITEITDLLSSNNKVFRLESNFVNGKGNTIWVLIRAIIDYKSKEAGDRLIGSISDISEQKTLAAQLSHNALHDVLTNLPNRALLINRTNHCLKRMLRSPEKKFALMLIGIKNFKTINENSGHTVGDQMIIEIGCRISETIRATDTVSRWGGDEFSILLDELDTPECANRAANDVLSKIQQPFSVNNIKINLSAGIGLTFIQNPNITTEKIFSDVDIAMHEAKSTHKSNILFFDTDMRQRSENRLLLENSLTKALQNDEFCLAYQPIYELTSQTPSIIGVEALLRWSNEGVNRAPFELLELAEQNGKIEDIGILVLQKSIAQLIEWQQNKETKDIYININLSSQHFENDKIVDTVLNELDKHQIPTQLLRIEIIETAVVKQPDVALPIIDRFRKEGVHVLIDDFGTGYSSLSYLHRFPFYALKIDRSFIQDVECGGGSSDIVIAIIDLAKRLNIEVVAEGVENKLQLEFLTSIGCPMCQGYYFSKPVSANDILQLIKPS